MPRSLYWQAWLVAFACMGTPGCSGCSCTACVPAPVHLEHLPIDGGFDVGMDAGMDASGPTDVCDNGLDDDGNGIVDERCVCLVGEAMPCYGGPAASARVGLCDVGAMTCIDVGGFGTWDDCLGWTLPDTEACDGRALDEDCDGRVDEHCAAPLDAMQSCSVGTESERGVGRCVSGTQAETLVAEGPDATPTPEWGPCEGAIGPTGEVCNGVDDDCDGTVDDGPVERCNLADDDCDVRVDEDTACAVEGEYWTRLWPFEGRAVLPSFASLYHLASDPALRLPTCSTGEIVIEESRHALRCVGLPPTDCMEGTRAEWLAGAWACVPCGVVVQAGPTLFFERRCEHFPSVACTDAQATEISLHDETWNCVLGCPSDALATFIDGRKLCVGL
jgi:hypothetical protein